jgi:DNA-nicking Smr family endonuclease
MDFGDILEQWDKETSSAYGKKRIKSDERKERDLSSRSTSNSPSSAPARPAPREGGLPSVNPMDAWLRRHGVVDKDSLVGAESPAPSPAERRRRLRARRPDASLDLHGCTREEAWVRLEAFFASAVASRLEKVVIIHGKGTHSEDDPVLGAVVRLFIERNPHAGESGFSPREEGGHGSTWVIIK